MNANAISLLAIFEKKMRLEVPLFQRQYVWSLEQQWEPLWEDISRKFVEYLEDRKDGPAHFLGAMVLDQKQTPITHVEKRQVIDGQQRLTTLQIFLAAFRDFCNEHECNELGKECNGFILNKGMMAEPEIDRYKVWPTQLDRSQFRDVVDAGSRAALEQRHPQQRRKYARRPEPRPKMVEAYLFFHEQLTDFFIGTDAEQPLLADVDLAQRLEECFQALRNSLLVVAIDLEKGDDAQVIFETLNARGEPLLPADLLRNYIFLRAARGGESQETLYDTYWRKFDDPFWRVEVQQGRLYRPRSDLFMQHFLASQQGREIPIKNLFVEYKYWIDRDHPFASVKEELITIARQGDHFRRILEPTLGDVVYSVAAFLDAFDVRTAYPFLLAILDHGLSDKEWFDISTVLESYLVRRAVCGLTTKNYNRIFLSLTKGLRREGATYDNLVKSLLAQTGESSEWPSDEKFSTAWLTREAYYVLNGPKLVHLLKRINETFLSKKTEDIQIVGLLTVEHILPQSWTAHWSLPDGSQGLEQAALLNAADDDPRALATRARNTACQTLGNLTLITQSLNSATSNSAWQQKKTQLLHSLLPINLALQSVDAWDEKAIADRGKALLARALKLWPRP